MTDKILEGEFVGNITHIEKQIKLRNCVEIINFHKNHKAAIMRTAVRQTNLRNLLALRQEIKFHESAINFLQSIMIEANNG